MNKEYKTENIPNKKIDTENIFGLPCNFEVFGFKEKSDHVPEIDSTYKFAVAYKPKIAFFEAHVLSGWESLEKIINYLNSE